MSDRLRASDRDRERAVDALRDAAGEGRLTVDELDERVSLAYAARTRGELLELLDDVLVPVEREPEPRPARRRPWLPGRAAFTARWTHDEPVTSGELVEMFQPLAREDFKLVERDADHLLYECRVRPGWTIAVAVLLFPFGLLALAYKDRETIRIDLARRFGRTICIAHGTGPLNVRRAFAELEED